MAAPQKSVTTLTERYGELRPHLPGTALHWLQYLRDKSLATFDDTGLPTVREERWKYTNLNRLRRSGFVPAPLASPTAIDSLPIGNALAIDAYKIVLVNGVVNASLSDLDQLPEGVTLDGTDTLPLDKFSQLLNFERTPVAALNTASFADAVCLYVRENALIEKPIHLISLGGQAVDPVAFHPRFLIDAGAGSHATFIESHVGLGGESYFSNSVVEIGIGRNAVLQHYKLQNEQQDAYHIAATEVRLSEGSTYENLVLTLGAQLSRNEINTEILGPNAECRLFGGYLLKDKQHGDHTTTIDHAAPECRSREIYKGVLDGRARGVFQGKVLVRKDSQKTDGHQLNQAILLSQGAEIDSKPELEIYADDVKCSHGATAGELDEDALFYLQSRGIDIAGARNLLIGAFLQSVIEEISNAPVQEAMGGIMSRWLDTGLGGDTNHV
ncbi:MAG: Fe-S cluster assembly protein SufD [Rhodospirillaceae bacterium]|nr:Fe-S cluster assembly protein SufD [Rhodospirillaceae bacterium]